MTSTGELFGKASGQEPKARGPIRGPGGAGLPPADPRGIWSPDRRYRYRLGWPVDSQFATPRRVLWVMLNPSTADELKLDPTLTRCRSFTREQSMGTWMEIVNLFAFRATDPSELRKAHDPVGPECDRHIAAAAAEADQVWVGWGAEPIAQGRAGIVLPILRMHYRGPIWCLGVTKDGAPKHPLYVPGAQQRVEFRPNDRPAADRKLRCWEEREGD
jgi:hypothetical protein